MQDNAPHITEVRLTYLIYGLHLFSAITGLMTSAFIITAFLTGWPSILAVILNYVKRDDVQGTYLASHFDWQIRTFWWTLAWLIFIGLLFITIIGIPFGWVVAILIGLWVLYRMIYGVLKLMSHRPISA